MSIFDYFQIASVAIFLFIVVGKTLSIRLRRNINPIAIGRGKSGGRFAFELACFAGLSIWVIAILSHALHVGFHFFPAWLEVRLFYSLTARSIGIALVALALIIFSGAFISFGDSWRVGFDVKTPGILVTNGIFAVSRNPIYLALDLWFCGILLINGNLIFLLFALLTSSAIHWQILQEEDFLRNLYGQPYRDTASGPVGILAGNIGR
jgi:protein-S-isoprenylcysteine O-methyltransferase Ste14